MTTRHLVFVQYGDYREAVGRFERGGDETYYGQRRSVEFVASLVNPDRRVTVICVNTDAHPEVCLSNGVHAIGLRLYKETPLSEFCSRVLALHPDFLVLGSPILKLWDEAVSRGCEVLPLFADSFGIRGVRDLVRSARLFRIAFRQKFRFVANHNVNASRSLLRMGFSADRIVPWDWPPEVRPHDHAVKSAPAESPFRLLYVGAVVSTKGIGDVVDAVALLRGRGRSVTLTVAGSGNVDEFKKLAAHKGVDDVVTFLGRIPHKQAFAEMLEHHAVVVPSRHEYPEGLPMVIYETFASRTPLIASDHPMFRYKVRDGKSGLVFLAGRSDLLADCVSRLMDDSELYSRLSEATRDAWEALQCVTTHADVINRFLGDPKEDATWLRTRSLSSGIYDNR